MSKRNTKQAMYQPRPLAYPDRKKPIGKGAAKTAAKPSRAASTRPASKAAQAAAARSSTADPFVLRVRMIAIVVVLTIFFGGVAWAVELNGVLGVPEAIAFIAMGFVGGLAAYVAIRTAAVIEKVNEFKRRRGL